MPLQNRVDPFGAIFRTPARGTMMGNRGGALHDDRREIVRPYKSRQWIACVLQFKDRHRTVMTPNRYTPLFFLDEAVALAAGHRPCAECRRSSYNEYRLLCAETHGGATPYANEMDTQLHRERTGGTDHRAAWDGLPDGVFVRTERGPAVVVGDRLAVWNRDGNTYGDKLARPRTGTAIVITPPSTVAILRAGYPVQIADVARKCN